MELFKTSDMEIVKYCHICRLSELSVVVCNAAGERAVRWPTLHGGSVRLRPVRATPCFVYSCD